MDDDLTERVHMIEAEIQPAWISQIVGGRRNYAIRK